MTDNNGTEEREGLEKTKEQADDLKSGTFLLMEQMSTLRRIAGLLLLLLMILGSALRSRALLSLFLLMILGGYLFPIITAQYIDDPGEPSASTEDSELQCEACHQHIQGEIEYPGAVGNVATSHRAASSEPIYVGPGTIIDIPLTPTGSIDDVCWMCHYKENNDRIGKESHYNRSEGFEIVTRACTDLDCHGDESQTTSGPIWGEIKTNVTGRISQIVDAHSRFYNPLNTLNSSLENEDGGFYTKGYFTCLACHTHVGFEFDIERPNKFTLRMREGVLEGVEINLSSTNTSLAAKLQGSAWR